MNNKGQSATEFLIILGVVIIIALIIVAVLGGIPNTPLYNKQKFMKECKQEYAIEFCNSINQIYINSTYSDIFLCTKDYDQRTTKDLQKKYYFLQSEIFNCTKLYYLQEKGENLFIENE